jgi:hypothetical protein
VIDALTSVPFRRPETNRWNHASHHTMTVCVIEIDNYWTGIHILDIGYVEHWTVQNIRRPNGPCSWFDRRHHHQYLHSSLFLFYPKRNYLKLVNEHRYSLNYCLHKYEI